MDYKYPHWYQDQGKMMPCCEEGFEPEMMCCEEEMPYKIHPYPATSFKDRIMCLLGDDVIFSVDASIWNSESQTLNTCRYISDAVEKILNAP